MAADPAGEQPDDPHILQDRYQWAHARRAIRLIMAIWLTSLFVGPDVLQSASASDRLVRTVITVAVVGVCDAWFTRRMGFSIGRRGITLHGAFLTKRLGWPDVTPCRMEKIR
jgi:hypothetical protein